MKILLIMILCNFVDAKDIPDFHFLGSLRLIEFNENHLKDEEFLYKKDSMEFRSSYPEKSHLMNQLISNSNFHHSVKHLKSIIDLAFFNSIREPERGYRYEISDNKSSAYIVDKQSREWKVTVLTKASNLEFNLYVINSKTSLPVYYGK